MKKLTFTFLFALLVLILYPTAKLSSVKADAYTNTFYTTRLVSDGCGFTAVDGDYIMDVQEALNLINYIRWEACVDGVPDPRNPSRNLTTSDYVEIKWSQDLEYIARVRAAEALIMVGQHSRLNGKDIWSVRAPNNNRSYGEILAWNYSSQDTAVKNGINQWYAEKADYIRTRNPELGYTGHYAQMVDPKNKYIGLGCFSSDYGYYRNSLAGEFNYTLSNANETPMATVNDCRVFLDVSISSLTNPKIEIASSEKYGEYYSDWDKGESAYLRYVYRISSGGYTGSVLTLNTVQWSLSNTNTAIINTDGKVSFTDIGDITVYGYDGLSQTSLTFDVNHDLSTLSAVSPTCTEDGKTEGQRCVRCNTITKKQRIISAFGHSWNDGMVTRPATYSSTGTKLYTCTRCYDTKTTTIAKKPKKNLSNGTITVASKVAYTGTARKPKVTVNYNGKVVNSDYYTVTYSNNTKLGTATVKVTAKTGNIPYKGTISKTFKIVLATPKITAHANKVGGIKIAWGGVTGAKGYIVYKNGVKYKTIASASARTYTDAKTKDIKNGTAVKYSVQAYYSSTVKSSKSAAITEYRMKDPVSLSSVTANGVIRLNMTKPSGVGYIIYRSKDGGRTYQKVGSTLTYTYRDTNKGYGLIKGKTYYYKVKTYKTINGEQVVSEGKKITVVCR